MLRPISLIAIASAYAALAVLVCTPDASAQVKPTITTARRAVRDGARISGWMNPMSRKRQYVYVVTNGAVNVYNIVGKLEGQITGLDNPYSVAVDRTADIYVIADSGSYIYVFKRGATQPFRTLGNPSDYAFRDVTVGRDGTVYAAWDVYEGYGGVIDVFAPGSNTPTELLYGGSFKALQRVATDREGNLYVTYNEFGSSGSGPAGVLEWAPHKKSPKQLQLDVSDPLGIDVTVDNDLVICDGDYYSSPAIKTFPPGQTEPSSAIPGECDDISLARHQTRIFATAYYSFARYQYPSGMGALTVGGLDNVYGVAVSGSVTDEE